MYEHRFQNLEEKLLAAGVAARFVRKTIDELSDHFTDLESEAHRAGYCGDEARAVARETLGSDVAIVAAVSAQRELLSWSRRWPRSARCVHRSCYYLLLPAAPFIYCCERGSSIARWSVSASLGVLVTGGMLFSLQWFIL